MLVDCKNCSISFKGDYCNNCGQPAKTDRINFHHLWHDIQHGIIHIDRGFFYTIIQLFTKPGQAIKEYLEGKRVKYYKPIPLLLIVAGFYAFLVHYFDLQDGLNSTKQSHNNVTEALYKFKSWASVHYSFMAIISLPVYAISNVLFFSRMRFNFTEYIVINAYVWSVLIMVHTVLLPLNYFKYDVVRAALVFVDFFVVFWIFTQLFKREKVMYVFSRTLYSYLLSAIIYLFFIVAGIFIII